MANTISTTIAINDNMSAVLIKVANATNNVTKSMETMSNVSSKATSRVTQSMQKTLTTADKMRSSIAQFDNAFATVSGKMAQVRVQAALTGAAIKEAFGSGKPLQAMQSAVEKLAASLKSLPTKAVESLKNHIDSVKLQASLAAGALKAFARVKVNNVVTGLNNIKSALTQGKTGAAGLITALKNIGKITVVGAVNSLNRLKNSLTQIRSVTTNAGNILKSMGTTITNVTQKGIAAFKKFGNSIAQSVKGKVKEISSALNGISVGVGAITAAAGVALKKIGDYSDTVIQTKARLDLMNDGMQTTEELQQKIYDSATRARGAYQSTADAVSKMGILAGDTFSSNDEIIAFMEQVNKQFTISGTSTEGVRAAMLQLTQAMGSGLLRGEELNSVLEQAPTIVQTIAKHLGVNVGTLREMAAEGLITSDVVKNALLGAAEETNAKFEAMPKTFGQVWTDFKNRALFAFQPVLEKINELANSGQLDAMLDQAANMLTKLGNAALDAFTWMSEHGDIVKAALIGIGVAITGMTVAMWAFNIAAMANPVVWIVLAIIAAVALLAAGIYLVVKHWDEISAAAGRCWEAIKGFFSGIGEWFANIWNTVVAGAQNVWQSIVNIWNSIVNAIKSAVSNAGAAIQNAWETVKNFTVSAWDTIKSKIADAWNGIVKTVTDKAKEIYASVKNKFNEIVDFIGNLKNTMLQKGKDIIQGLIDGVTSKITALANKIREVGQTVTNGIKSFFNIGSPSKVMRELGQWTFEGFNLGLDDMISRIKRTTLNMGDAVTETSSSELAGVRKAAVNNSTSHTTIHAPVTIRIANTNEFKSDADISRFTRTLANGIAEQIGMQLEGVTA